MQAMLHLPALKSAMHVLLQWIVHVHLYATTQLTLQALSDLLSFM